MSQTRSSSSSLRKSSRVRRLSEKALNCDNKDQFINNLNKLDHHQQKEESFRNEEEPLLKKRRTNESMKMHSNKSELTHDFNFINVNFKNEEDEDFLTNLDEENKNTIHNMDEELKETELRISKLFDQQQQEEKSPMSPTTPTVAKFSNESESELELETATTSLEEFLNYDLMPSLTDVESDSETSSNTAAAAGIEDDYLPQYFDYRSNHDSVNFSLIQNEKGKNDGNKSQKVFINAIKKRSGDVFLTDGMFNHFY